MENNNIKKQLKPSACNEPPWYGLIPENERFSTLAKINQETIAIYGQSYSECVKRKVCFTKTCRGRPLPIAAPSFQPYLKQLEKTHDIVNGEMFLSNCDTCVLVKSCKSPCAQINDFLNRDKSEEPSLVFTDNLDNIETEKSIIGSIMNKDLTIPWDCISIKRKQTVEKYLYEQKDFVVIAEELGYSDQSTAKYEFYMALTKMSRVAAMRQMIKDKSQDIQELDLGILQDLFVNNLDLTITSGKYNKEKTNIVRLVKKYVNKYNVKWKVYAKKDHSNTATYNVPELFK